MEEKNKKCAYRKRLQEEMKQIQPKEIFGTSSYLNMMKSIARELTDGRFDNVKLYYNPSEPRMGWCDGRSVSINFGNGLTESFAMLPQKNISLVGILGHECGHKNYSDFGLRKKYLDGMLEGIWYPYPPDARTAQEEADLEQMKGYFIRRDQDALALIVQVAAYLQNVLEDIYVEDKMCARFPGSVRRGILLNRDRNVEWIPTLRELLEGKEDKVSILMNLCAQYALSGRINNWDNGESDLLDTMDILMPVIRKACTEERSSARFLAVNRMILNIWKYLYEIIREIEEQREEQADQQEAEQQNDGEQETEQEETGEENTSCDEPKQRGQDKEREQEAKQEISTGMQEYLKHLADSAPKFMREEENEKERVFRGFPEDVWWSGSWQYEESETKSITNTNEAEEAAGTKTEPAIQKEDTGTLIMKVLDADGGLQEILYHMAKEAVDAQVNQEINLQLQREMDDLPFDSGHARVKKKVCRECQITELQKEKYQKYQEQVKKVQRRLFSTVLPILQDQGARTERRMFLGKRIDMRSIADSQGAIYQKYYPGKKVDMALEILLDMSESMSGARMEQSKLSALCLYDFCRKAKIPVAVYGHHTDGYRHRLLEDETVFLHCCVEFEPDEKDRYRIASLKPNGANRDGVALTFMAEKLLKRPEKQKLLVLISDGFPNSNQYRGEKAKADLTEIKKKYMNRGILFLAAAIGADKEKIQEIYQEAFLDISEIEKLPVALTKQVVKYIRRF